jgi:hypothetical protein
MKDDIPKNRKKELTELVKRVERASSHLQQSIKLNRQKLTTAKPISYIAGNLLTELRAALDDVQVAENDLRKVIALLDDEQDAIELFEGNIPNA